MGFPRPFPAELRGVSKAFPAREVNAWVSRFYEARGPAGAKSWKGTKDAVFKGDYDARAPADDEQPPEGAGADGKRNPQRRGEPGGGASDTDDEWGAPFGAAGGAAGGEASGTRRDTAAGGVKKRSFSDTFTMGGGLDDFLRRRDGNAMFERPSVLEGRTKIKDAPPKLMPEFEHLRRFLSTQPGAGSGQTVSGGGEGAGAGEPPNADELGGDVAMGIAEEEEGAAA